MHTSLDAHMCPHCPLLPSLFTFVSLLADAFAQRGNFSFFCFCLSCHTVHFHLSHAPVLLYLIPSLSNLFLPLPASRCPGTLGDWGSGFSSFSTQGLEELVLSEMNSPSRTQTGDSSSVSSFSYREILREKESSTVPARVRGKEELTAQLPLPKLWDPP